MNPLLTDTPVVTINGKSMNLPRLSLGSTFAIIKLVKELMTPETIGQAINAYKQAQSKEETEADYFEFGMTVFDLIFGALDNAEEEIYKVVSMILKITKEEAVELSLEDIVNIGIAFKDHPDVSFFTKKLPKVIKSATGNLAASPMTS